MSRIKKESIDYEPIVPNILDKSMIPDDKTSLTVEENSYPLGKKILIGSLIVIIIILVIILIYQLYHYFNDDKAKSPPKNPPPKNPPPRKLPPKNPPPKNPSKKFIPDEIRSLDDDALKQFIKAPKQQQVAPRHPDTRKVQQQTLTESIIENTKESDFVEQKEIEQLKILEDDTILEETDLTKDDMLEELKKEMDEDADDGELAKLEIDDSMLVDSIMKGCQHTLLSGKRKGEKCGNTITTRDRCNKHK